eukprot:9496782-Pyramimonas_sp.AAC.1
MGNVQDARGGALAICGPPWRLMSYGSLLRAIYKAHELKPEHDNVKATIAAGLVDEFNPRTPEDVILFIKSFFNGVGGGTGVSFKDKLDMILQVNAHWVAHANKNGIQLSRAGTGANSVAVKRLGWCERTYPGVFQVKE